MSEMEVANEGFPKEALGKNRRNQKGKERKRGASKGIADSYQKVDSPGPGSEPDQAEIYYGGDVAITIAAVESL